MKSVLSVFFLLFVSFSLVAQALRTQPLQPESGPGGSDYSHSETVFMDFAEKEDGYWLFEPASPRPDSAHLVVFLHGYGGYNPMVYGKWIRHIVQKGNIVLYPRYQKNLRHPRPKHFAANVVTAIKDYLKKSDEGAFIKPITRQLALVGHSYGGVISADLAMHYSDYGIPKPVAAMLCSPGTAIFKGGRYESYEKLPEDLKLLVMVNSGDKTVGDEFGILVYQTATDVKNRNFIRQYPDFSGEPYVGAGHNESYALDTLFDTGVRNFTAKRALRIGKVDAVDFFGYWKLFDALLDCSRQEVNCEYAFGNTILQSSLGNWSDGEPIRNLEIHLPETPTAIRKEE